MARVLIVDDDADIRHALGALLRRQGHEVVGAADGADALQTLAGTDPFDLIVLDINMPGLDGIEVCRRVRQREVLPILFLSARGGEQDKVQALMAGGDDYLVKPFSAAELEARITAQLRRYRVYPAAAQATRLRAGNLEVDPEARQAWVGGQPVALTAREFAIVELLARRPSRVFSVDDIYRHAWQGAEAVADKTVMAHISNIRHKFAGLGDTSLIRTVWGAGYRLL
ncbi:response regulator transcription factor [Crenobacter intestini]|uniref:Response regulator transcription factor n=1 Tax=Crenobacter intestini TaxID=2563443 RepID=A0A4T0USA8_9NEIS|nr:response regulator transcription factor [Crenobacter intestini]TIC81365.1 response regulator transcription factor [Crenobacter intestini]